MRLLLAIFVSLLFVGGAHARGVPPLSGPVVDEAQVLTSQGRATLEARLREVERNGAQGVILTVKDLGGEDMFTFTQKVFDQWKLGTRKVDNGFLIVYSKADKKLRFHTGYGLEGTIPDIYALHIADTILDTARKQPKGKADPAAAFAAGLDVVEKLLKKEPVTIKKHASQADVQHAWFILVFFVSAFAGWFHFIIGGIVGAGVSAGIAGTILAATLEEVMIWALIGFVIGLIANWVFRNVWDFGPWSGGGGFSGGGGMSGGGGAEAVGDLLSDALGSLG